MNDKEIHQLTHLPSGSVALALHVGSVLNVVVGFPGNLYDSRRRGRRERVVSTKVRHGFFGAVNIWRERFVLVIRRRGHNLVSGGVMVGRQVGSGGNLVEAARLVATCTASIWHCAGRCLLLAVGLIDDFVGRRRRGVGSTAEATGTAGTGPAATMTMTWFAYM